MNYIDILNNELVIENYGKIDEINPYPFIHGLKHVKNVCKIMNDLCDILGIDGEKKEALLIASALHDIGQVDGREEHGKKAAIFLQQNFENEIKNNKFYNDILIAIEKHDNVCEVSNSLFTILVQFCDKMDFSKERLEEDYLERFGHICYEKIERIDFIYDENNFGINIITNDDGDFKDEFLKRDFTKKVINAVTVLAEKLNRMIVFQNNGNPLDIVV